MTSIDTIERTNCLLAAGDAVYAARQTGLYRIGAGGDERNLYRSWLPDQDLPTLAIAAAGKLLLAGINGGVARSEDGGIRWKAHHFRAPAPLVTSLALSPAFDEDGCVLAGAFEDGAFRSTDGGESWTAVNHGLFDHSVYALALSPQFDSDGIAYAGTGSGIYRSDNGGTLWWDLTMPAGDETVLSLALAESGALYAGCETHGLLRSNDAGLSWEALLETDGALNSVALAKDGAIIAQVDDGLWLSRDDGASWSDIASENVDCMSLGADGETLRLALADGSIRQSSL
ncbi:MAG: hypothetical protein OXI77_15145 [Chloroflexota bacterium]|nr:hypothetical protein [Chloroflexota bacterium]MDE2909591.1 hypothetical protein [Chloroflexota bacterium]